MPDKKKRALILSGGSARGAYEVGVLKYIFQELPRIYGPVPRFDIICGTSVGAIHACFIVAHMKTIRHDIDRLVGIWGNLKPNHVIRFDLNQFFRWKDLIFGGLTGGSLFGVSPLASLLGRENNFEQIRTSVMNNDIETLCVSTTATRSGKTVVFTQTNQPVPHDSFRTEFRSTDINLDHAMASASMPFLFPPVRINGAWYTDGGIRQNTPIAPALSFGATHVLAIGLWHDHDHDDHPVQNDHAPSAGLLIGKIFNSFFLDNAQSDLHNLNNMNRIIQEGTSLYGDGFARHLAGLSKPFRHLEACQISPSQDIGRITADYLSNKQYRKNRFYKMLLKLIDLGSWEADLASYLLFDGEYSKILMDLGFRDAESKQHEIARFLDLI